jgi:hypothetical protein
MVSAMGFSIKLAPGIRIRASSRGLRASVGPRAARVHFGSGRTGVSTGFGPVGFYSSLGGGRSRSGRGRTTTSVASYQRQLAAQQRQSAQAQKLEIAHALSQTFQAIIDLHRVEFPPASAPTVAAPAPPDRAAIHRHYEKTALKGVGLFDRRGRKDAKARAASWTEAEVQRQWAAGIQQQADWQQYYTQCWNLLCGNDPDTVVETLNAAFEDNEAPSAAIGVDGSEVALVILVPPMSGAVPEQWPTTTEAGNLSLKKLTQRERGVYYQKFVCGHILVTLREAFAVAPGIASARVVVLRHDGADAYGRPTVSCLTAGRFERRALNGVQWATADAVRIVNDVASELLINQRGRSAELGPIDLANEDELQKLIQTIDLSELVGGTS